MAGVLIEYQGLVARQVTFRRSQGYGADRAELIVPAGSFPTGFTWEIPGSLTTRVSPQEAQFLAPLRSQAPAGGGVFPFAGLPRGLKAEGTLILATVEPDGTTRLVPVPNMFIQRIDSDVTPTSGVSWLRLTLVDERFFSQRGVMKRWSFNRRIPGTGKLAADSLGDKGRPITQAQILTDDVAPQLFRGPKVSAVPARWCDLTPELDMPPYTPAVSALRQLVDDAQTEEPCLRLDGTLAIHEHGDGMVGYAEGGEGPNTLEFPVDVLLYEGGRGQRFAIEGNYPEEFFVVVSERPTVATVALDDWEPVVIVRGEPFLLSEEFVRKVTGGVMGVDGLREFVLIPRGEQALVDIPPEVNTLFAEQAFQLWRMPGVEKQGSDVTQDTGAQAEGGERVGPGFYNGDPGPNAHLLPMLPRAETQGGKRLPISIETYRFVSRRKQLLKDGGGQGAATVLALAQLQKAQAAVRQETTRTGTANLNDIDPSSAVEFDWGKRPFPSALGAAGEGSLSLGGFFGSAGTTLAASGLDRQALGSYLTTARRVHLMTERLGGALGANYEKAFRAKLAAEDAQNGTAKLAQFNLATEMVKLAQEAKDSDGLTDQQFGEALKDAIDTAKREVQRAKAKKTQSTVTGVGSLRKGLLVAVALDNLPRSVDTRARVYDKGLGIVKTGGLAGHVDDPGVAVPSATLLKLCPVRVVFGATLRPRVDEKNPKPPRPTTGTSPKKLCPGGANVVPVALTDRESHFARGYKRVKRGAVVEVPLDSVPLEHAARIRMPLGAQQLLPLEGAGNFPDLRSQAESLAKAASAIPAQTKGATVRLAGPWPVQCDGLVKAVEITTDMVDGTPAGFTTTVHVGGSPDVIADANRSRPRKPSDGQGHLLNR